MPYKHPELTLKRIRKFIDRESRQGLHARRLLLQVEAKDLKGEPEPYAEVLKGGGFRKLKAGAKWGGVWGTTWFRFTATVPADWKGEKVVARILLRRLKDGVSPNSGFDVEGLAFTDGKPAAAINRNRQKLPLLEKAKGGEKIEFYLEAAANPPSLMGRAPDALLLPEYTSEPICVLDAAELVTVDEEEDQAFYDFDVVYEVMQALPEKSPRRQRLLFLLNEAVNAYDPADPQRFRTLRAALKPAYAGSNASSMPTVSCIGHAHIDTAWLWPLRETIRKCARTFQTQLSYMPQYPKYVFGCSQAVQYAWMKEHYPTVFKGIQEAVKKGQWEPIGSSWVEADCNISSGESLLRQMAHGKRFFKDELGYETREMWLPDVFGYSASFPQVMKHCGVEYFFTQKISWSQFNKFPHHTFYWEGIDGTRIFTHFTPTDTYNGNFYPSQLLRGLNEFKEADRASRWIYPFGEGDGGGGPDPRMLEYMARLTDFEGVPKVQAQKVIDFFPEAEADIEHAQVWRGELYLELHRGTYTTHSKVKRGNRKGEEALREAELLDALDVLLGSRGRGSEKLDWNSPERSVYDVGEPKDAKGRGGRVGCLDRAWKLLLLNQFHDIIPGSSIHWVYEDAHRDYAAIAELVEKTRAHAQEGLTGKGFATGGIGRPLLVTNSLGYDRAEVGADAKGKALWLTAPSCGYRVNDRTAAGKLPEGLQAVTVKESKSTVALENGLVRVTVDRKTGELLRVRDLAANREVLDKGARGNALQLFEDTPASWNAWDVDVFYQEKPPAALPDAESVEVAEAGELRGVVAVKRTVGQSTVEQRIVLRAGSARIDFETKVDWREREKLLKAAFPLAVRSLEATYEIQYGTVTRPTHRNTSWDMARFEVAAQTWADLSEGDYGAALLNDCKYGYDCDANVLRISLLRAPVSPDPVADRGTHTFTYSLLPHAGDWREGGVAEEAHALNAPLRVTAIETDPKGKLPAEHSLVRVDKPGTVVSAVKWADEGDALIVRLYEGRGTRGTCNLQIGVPVQSVHRANGLEEAQGKALPLKDGAVALGELRPFEVVTLRVATA